MANRRMRLLIVLAVFGLVLAGAGLKAGMAQPADQFYCRDTRYDWNYDGVLSKADMYAFFNVTARDGCLYREVTGACGQYDLDGNQVVDDRDMSVAHSYFMGCYKTADDNPR